MDFALFRFLICLYPGVAAYVLSERLILRMGRGRRNLLNATLGILCFSAWIFGIYWLLLRFEWMKTSYNKVNDFFHLAASKPHLHKLIVDLPDVIILLCITLFVTVLYAVIKNYKVDDFLLHIWPLKWIGAHHNDRSEVWNEFRESYLSANSWVRIEFQDGSYCIASIYSISSSQDIDTLLLLEDVTLYKSKDDSKGKPYHQLLIDFHSSNVSRVLIHNREA